MEQIPHLTDVGMLFFFFFQKATIIKYLVIRFFNIVFFLCNMMI